MPVAGPARLITTPYLGSTPASRAAARAIGLAAAGVPQPLCGARVGPEAAQASERRAAGRGGAAAAATRAKARLIPGVTRSKACHHRQEQERQRPQLQQQQKVCGGLSCGHTARTSDDSSPLRCPHPSVAPPPKTLRPARLGEAVGGADHRPRDEGDAAHQRGPRKGRGEL
jgi:hypothetical protein